MFCQRFKAALDSSGLSRRELTEKTGVSAASISQYLRGKNVPGEKTRKVLANALGVPVEFLDGDLQPISGKKAAPATMSVAEAARRLGVSYKTVTRGLKLKIFPWGYALPPEGEHSEWTYVIIRARFEAEIAS